MFFTKMCPSGGTKYVSFELVLGILRGPREGRGGTPGMVPLQNPEVTSQKACLRDADPPRLQFELVFLAALVGLEKQCLRFLVVLSWANFIRFGHEMRCEGLH